MYLDKSKMHKLLVDYQMYNSLLDNNWLENYKSAPRKPMNEEQRAQFFKDRDEFKVWRYKQYEEKVKFLGIEADDQRTIREAKVKSIEANLATMFYQIIDGLILVPEFNNHKVPFWLKSDMKSQGIWAMYSYIERYDVRKTNPFSYFTEIAKNGFRKIKDDYNLQQMRCTSSDFSENLDNEFADSNWLVG